MLLVCVGILIGFSLALLAPFCVFYLLVLLGDKTTGIELIGGWKNLTFLTGRVRNAKDRLPESSPYYTQNEMIGGLFYCMACSMVASSYYKEQTSMTERLVLAVGSSFLAMSVPLVFIAVSRGFTQFMIELKYYVKVLYLLSKRGRRDTVINPEEENAETLIQQENAWRTVEEQWDMLLVVIESNEDKHVEIPGTLLNTEKRLYKENLRRLLEIGYTIRKRHCRVDIDLGGDLCLIERVRGASGEYLSVNEEIARI